MITRIKFSINYAININPATKAKKHKIDGNVPWVLCDPRMIVLMGDIINRKYKII